MEARTKATDENTGLRRSHNKGVHSETDTFRDLTNCAEANRPSNLNDYYNSERYRALKAIEKSDYPLKTNKSTHSPSPLKYSSKLEKTDYVYQRPMHDFDISELVTSNTIDLDVSSSPPSAASSSSSAVLSKHSVHNKLSDVAFEPSEITGRSTLAGSRYGRSSTTSISVQELLSTSFAPNVRKLSMLAKSARGNSTSGNSTSSALSYSTQTLDSRLSLPRTADLSNISKKSFNSSELSLNGGEGFSITGVRDTAAHTTNEGFDTKDFMPAELMESKLVLDEIAWADDKAAIPTKVLSEQAKAKLNGADEGTFHASGNDGPKPVGLCTTADFERPSYMGQSMDSDFSMGSFFRKRSEELGNIVHSLSPSKDRSPIALVDVEDVSIPNGNVAMIQDELVTPKVDNKAYSRVNSNTVTIKKANQPREGGRKSPESDNSFYISKSRIEDLLQQMNLNTDDSDADIVERILRAKAATENGKHGQETPRRSKSKTPIKMVDLTEEKENIDPQLMSADTMSFSESMLNVSEAVAASMLYTHRACSTLNGSGGRASKLRRSPLSPLDIPRIKVTYDGDEANEADIDEFDSPCKNSTRDKSPTRRLSKRSPTPRENGKCECVCVKSKSVECTPPCKKQSSREEQTQKYHKAIKTPSPQHDAHATQKSPPLLPQNSRRELHKQLQQKNEAPRKTLSSTRFDGEAKSNADSALNVESPNRTSRSVMAPITNGVGGSARNNNSRGSPITFLIPPFSSPRSGFCSQASSPGRYDNGSPQLDSTSSTDRQFLHGRGAEASVRHSASSPVSSEPGAVNHAHKFGVAPTRSNSATSITSGSSTLTGLTARSTSRCSNSSEYSHRDGKLIPLKVTKLDISWGSTRLRTEAQKSVQVKNTSTKRLVVRLEVHGPGFQIVNLRSSTLTLQSQECCTIVLNFSPTVTGVAIGSLSFFPPKGSTTKSNVAFLEIPLYAYGGHSTIMVDNYLQGPVGAPFMPMGKLSDLGGPLERIISICNRGSLLGFAFLHLDCLGLNLPPDSFSLEPDRMLIPPGDTVSVRCVFRPKREDMKRIIKKITNVVQLASMRIVSGNEANRQRVRHLVQRMSAKTRANLSPLEGIWGTFPNETSIEGLEQIKESTESAFDLASYMVTQEIALTLNHDFMDESMETSSIYIADADDTVIFRTVCLTSPTPDQNLDPINELLEANTTGHGIACDTAGDDEQASSSRSLNRVEEEQERRCTVQPKVISFQFNEKDNAALLIRNAYKSRQYFEITNSHPYLLKFTPDSGYIEAEGQIQVDIQLNSLPRKFPDNSAIIIHLDSERIVVPVIGKM